MVKPTINVGEIGSGQRVVGARIDRLESPQTKATDAADVLVGATMKFGVGKVFTDVDELMTTLKQGGISALERRGFINRGQDSWILGDAAGTHQKVTFIPAASTVEVFTVSQEPVFSGSSTWGGRTDFSLMLPKKAEVAKPSTNKTLTSDDKWREGIFDALSEKLKPEDKIFRQAQEVVAVANNPNFIEEMTARGYRLVDGGADAGQFLFQIGDPVACGQQVLVTDDQVGIETRAAGRVTTISEYR
jgi:hypothetical protein